MSSPSASEPAEDSAEDSAVAVTLRSLPDALIVHALSFLRAREIAAAIAVVWGAAAEAATRRSQLAAAIALHFEHLPLPRPPPRQHGDDVVDGVDLESVRDAFFLDRVLERQRVAVAAGGTHAVCLRPGDSRPYSWGGLATLTANLYGTHYSALHHLGHGVEFGPCVRTPMRMVGLDDRDEPLVECAAGRDHTLVLCEGGTVFACGEDAWGQIGMAPAADDASGPPPGGGAPPPGAGAMPNGLHTRHALLRPVAQLVAEGVHVVQIAAGGAYSLAVSAHGAVYEFGSHTRPLSGDPTALRRVAGLDSSGFDARIVQASASEGHALCVAEDGRAFAWGRNGQHQCGLGLASSDGRNRMHAWGLYIDVPRPVPLEVRVRQVSAGRSHSLFVCAGGALYSCGCGEAGRLGHGDEGDRTAPCRVETLPAGVSYAAAGSDHSVVIVGEDARVWSFGGGKSGQLGLPRREDYHWPTPIEDLAVVSASHVAAGDQFTLVVARCGRVFSAGWNAQGQLGLGSGQAAARLPEEVALPAASSTLYELRAQWTVQCSFNVPPPRQRHWREQRGAAWAAQQVEEPD